MRKIAQAVPSENLKYASAKLPQTPPHPHPRPEESQTLLGGAREPGNAQPETFSAFRLFPVIVSSPPTPQRACMVFDNQESKFENRKSNTRISVHTFNPCLVDSFWSSKLTDSPSPHRSIVRYHHPSFLGLILPPLRASLKILGPTAVESAVTPIEHAKPARIICG